MQRFFVPLCHTQNNLMHSRLLTVFFLLAVANAVCAQDKIYRKNGQIIKAKILEIGVEEVKYKPLENPDGPLYVLPQDKIWKIVFENGKVEKFSPDLKDPEQYEGQLRKALKVDFLGPLLGYTQITYEKSTAVGRSYELTLGIIGAGKNQRMEWYDNAFRLSRRNQFGLVAAAGYKFNKLPDFLFGRTRFSHVMQGSYVKPILYAGHYSENRLVYKAYTQATLERRNTTFGALQLELGKQWIYGDRFAVDLYWGVGYGFDNKKDDNAYAYYPDDNTSAYNYINARAGRSPGVSFTFGLKVGWLLK